MKDSFLISKEKIYNAFIFGAREVIKERDYLNKINVFPIRDGDTGSNLTSLMMSIINKSRIEHSLQETLNSISDAALMGSKGNSGIIFSQFFYDLSKEINDEYIDKNKLINQMENGYNYAYKSIETPVEGTIITLMRKWMLLLKKEKENYDNLKDYLNEANKQLKIEINNTKKELDVLKKYDVVDAGALGFTIFVDGFVKGIVGDEAKFDIEKNNFQTEKKHIEHKNTDKIDFRYCTEVLIETSLDKKMLIEKINNLGDSLVVGKSSKYTKIHIHTNQPEILIFELNKISKIIESKVEDMINQYNLNTNKKFDIAIVTDSIADIPISFIEKKQIQIFPVNITINNVNYLDKITIKNNQLFDLINNSDKHPISASPSLLSVKNLFTFLSNYYKKIIVITVSSKMSSTYEVFKTVSKDFNDIKIEVIDSKKNSIAEGLIVKRAIELLEQNKPYEELIDEIKLLRDKTNILVHVKTLDNMVRSGRIKKGLGRLAKIINLKPIVSIDNDGNGIVYKKSIGEKNNIRKIIKHIKKIHKKNKILKYAIVHVNNLKLAEYLKVKIIEITGLKQEYITEISSVIAMNSGLGSVAVGYITEV